MRGQIIDMTDIVRVETPWYRNYNMNILDMNTWIWIWTWTWSWKILMAWINTCTRNVLRITWKSGTWWLYGLGKDTMVQLFLAHGSRKTVISYNKFGYKNDQTRGKFGRNLWWKLRKCTLSIPIYVQGMVVFILHGAYHFVIWVIDELILLIYYYTILVLAWFPLGYKNAFSTSSFQTTITIDWYVRIGCGVWDAVVFVSYDPIDKYSRRRMGYVYCSWQLG